MAKKTTPKSARCTELFKLSTQTGNAELHKKICESCSCIHPEQGGTTVWNVRYVYKELLRRNAPCDETLALIPKGSTIEAQMSLRLTMSVCPDTEKPLLVGHSAGQFLIAAPEGRPLFTGSMVGTEGFDPRGHRGERCCDRNAGAGIMTGLGRPGRTRNFRLRASYATRTTSLYVKNPCEKLSRIRLFIDGVVERPCPTDSRRGKHR